VVLDMSLATAIAATNTNQSADAIALLVYLKLSAMVPKGSFA